MLGSIEGAGGVKGAAPISQGGPCGAGTSRVTLSTLLGASWMAATYQIDRGHSGNSDFDGRKWATTADIDRRTG